MLTPASALATTAGGYLLVLAIILPVVGILLSLVIGGRYAERIALALMPVGLGIALAITIEIWRTGKPLVYILGGWTPPLGIALRADGFSAVMLVTAALVIPAAGYFARANFQTPHGQSEARAPLAFWTLLQALWAALNIVFLGGDLFNLYVALELLTFAAVPLVCLDGRPETLVAALRYLLFALFGSVFYLLGVALLYGTYGTLDIVLLSSRVRTEPAVYVAAGLMTAGLLAKTALFPLHLWLPPAHANAPAPASAVLSALVVLLSDRSAVVRCAACADDRSGNIGPGHPRRGGNPVRQHPGAAPGATETPDRLFHRCADRILVPDVPARHRRTSLERRRLERWRAPGPVTCFCESLGHDRIADLRGLGRAMPMTVVAFGLGGLSLMGLPPSGGFAAKWLLVKASVESGQWQWAVVMLLGGLLAGGYVYRVLAPALANGGIPLEMRKIASRSREAVALALAFVAVLLGLAPSGFFTLLQIGRSAATAGLQ